MNTLSSLPVKKNNILNIKKLIGPLAQKIILLLWSFPINWIGTFFLQYFQKLYSRFHPRFPDVKDLKTIHFSHSYSGQNADNQHLKEKPGSRNKCDWKGPLRSPTPSRFNFTVPFSKLHRVAWGHTQSCSEHIQEWRFHSLSWPIPAFNHLYCQNCFPSSSQNFLL